MGERKLNGRFVVSVWEALPFELQGHWREEAEGGREVPARLTLLLVECGSPAFGLSCLVLGCVRDRALTQRRADGGWRMIEAENRRRREYGEVESEGAESRHGTCQPSTDLLETWALRVCFWK